MIHRLRFIFLVFLVSANVSIQAEEVGSNEPASLKSLSTSQEHSAKASNLLEQDSQTLPSTKAVSEEKGDDLIHKEVVHKTADDQAISVKTSKSPDPLGELPVVVGTLFLLICFIFLLAWMARRFTPFNPVKGKSGISISSTVSVGTRERISLIEVEGQKLLVGITAQQITHLHTFEGVNVEDNPAPSEGSFIDKLTQAMQKNRANHIDSEPDSTGRSKSNGNSKSKGSSKATGGSKGTGTIAEEGLDKAEINSKGANKGE